MKTAIIFTVIGLLIILLTYYMLEVSINNTVDIHFRDTVIEFEKPVIATLTALFLVTLFSLGGLLGTGFRSWFFILMFLASISAIAYLAWTVNNILNGH